MGRLTVKVQKHAKFGDWSQHKDIPVRARGLRE